MAAIIVGGYYGFRIVRGLVGLGYVDSAIGRVRAISAAEAQFAKEHPELGYTCTLSELPRSGEIARLLAQKQIDNGYVFQIVGCEKAVVGNPNSIFYITARPLRPGLPAFCSDRSTILKSEDTGSVENCISRGVPLGS